MFTQAAPLPEFLPGRAWKTRPARRVWQPPSGIPHATAPAETGKGVCAGQGKGRGEMREQMTVGKKITVLAASLVALSIILGTVFLVGLTPVGAGCPSVDRGCDARRGGVC